MSWFRSNKREREREINSERECVSRERFSQRPTNGVDGLCLFLGCSLRRNLAFGNPMIDLQIQFVRSKYFAESSCSFFLLKLLATLCIL